MMGHVFSTWRLARILRVDASTVSKWIDANLLKGFYTPGGHRRVEESELIAFMRSHRMPIPRELTGDGATPLGCQHVHLTSGIQGTGATCQECGARFKLSPATAAARPR